MKKKKKRKTQEEKGEDDEEGRDIIKILMIIIWESNCNQNSRALWWGSTLYSKLCKV